MIQPNPTIDLAKARAAMTKFRKLSQLDRPAAMGMWFVTYAEALLTALEQITEAGKPFVDIGHQRAAWGIIHKSVKGMEPVTLTVTKAQMLALIAALGNTPGDTE